MNTFAVSRKFQTRKDCIKYLEKLRWSGKPVCPYCGSRNTVRIKTEDRHHCNKKGCKRSFSVLIGTIFEDSRLPLPKFFMLVSLMLEARNGVSSKRISANLGITYKSAWYGCMRVRCAMIETITDLSGIVEADESFLGGKPRKRNIPVDDNTASLSRRYQSDRPKRGRGADKAKVAGFVERDGRVITKMLKRLTAQELLTMLHRYVKEEQTRMITDDYKSYNSFDEFVQREIIQHGKKEYVKGDVHTNTIEGFWSIIKNGIRGQYHVLSRKYLPFYLAEWSYKYNRRNLTKVQFDAFMKDAVSDSKCLLHYKPVDDVRDIVYPRKVKPKKAMVSKFQTANKKAGEKRRKKVRKKKRKLARLIKKLKKAAVKQSKNKQYEKGIKKNKRKKG